MAAEAAGVHSSCRRHRKETVRPTESGKNGSEQTPRNRTPCLFPLHGFRGGRLAGQASARRETERLAGQASARRETERVALQASARRETERTKYRVQITLHPNILGAKNARRFEI